MFLKKIQIFKTLKFQLISKYDINKAAFFKAETRLITKKEDLFKNPNINRWEISQDDLKKIDKTEIMKNKDYAFKFMMSKVIFCQNIFIRIITIFK